MIKAAKLGKQIVVTVVNKIGVLADMSKLLADHGINIQAVAGYAVNNEAQIMLVTDDNLRASDALKKSGYNSLREEEVVIIDLEDKPGALKIVTSDLAKEGVDIKQLYGTTCGSKCPAKMILSTNNNEKALLVFKK